MDSGALGKTESERGAALRFIRAAAGRHLHHESTRRFPDVNVECEFARDSIIADVRQSRTGFTFDVIYAIHQRNWDLDSSGRRIGAAIVRDRTLVRRFEVGEMRSTGKLLGFAHTIAQAPEESLEADALDVGCTNGRLEIVASTIGYADLYGRGTTCKPGAMTCTYVLREESVGLVLRERCDLFDVDPGARGRTKIGEQSYVDVETKGRCAP